MCMLNVNEHKREIIHSNQIDQMKFKFSTHYFFELCFADVGKIQKDFFFLCAVAVIGGVSLHSFVSLTLWLSQYSTRFRMHCA